jgi:hypothetical protein
MWPISTRVNKPENDDRSIVEPIATATSSCVFHPKVRPQLDVVPGPYLITRRLPATQDGEFQYEIRNTLEEYNRVARESELTRA